MSTTGSNAVIDLVRQTSTRRLATDPSDDVLFQSRDESQRGAWPRGTVNWSPPPPEPVTHPRAPENKRTWWKVGALAMAAVAGVAAAMIGFGKDAKDLAHPQSLPPPAVAASQPQPQPQSQSQPQPQPQSQPSLAINAGAATAGSGTDTLPAVAAVPPAAEPAIGSPPTVVDTPPTVESRPAKAAAPTKSKRRVHAEKKRVAKPKHVATATTTPPPPPAAAAPVRHAGQAHDNENPL